jgi:DNA-binding Xre family transcriptional regulator
MLADQADLSLSYISMVEGGRRDIRWTTLLKLIVALECRPGDVLTTLARGRVAEHLREVR